MPPATPTSCSPSGSLVPICVANGWPFQRWTEFSEIHAWLNEILDAWRRDPGTAAMPQASAEAVLLRPGGVG